MQPQDEPYLFADPRDTGANGADAPGGMSQAAVAGVVAGAVVATVVAILVVWLIVDRAWAGPMGARSLQTNAARRRLASQMNRA